MTDNVAFFLVPKKEVAYLPINCTMRQAMERMENRGFRAVPIIDEDNKYVGTLSEGDLLWKFKNTPGLTLKGTEKVMLKDIPRRMDNQPVRIYASINDLITLVIDQNFVPVVDDHDVFIGIVRRREVLEHYTKQNQTDEKQEKAKSYNYAGHILADASI
ncbi:MAG: CBS domain-containing protein [Eubacteriales bacterium]|nr:CBS domain-containing protein [Eubacteriales bacterium]